MKTSHLDALHLRCRSAGGPLQVTRPDATSNATLAQMFQAALVSRQGPLHRHRLLRGLLVEVRGHGHGELFTGRGDQACVTRDAVSVVQHALRVNATAGAIPSVDDGGGGAR